MDYTTEPQPRRSQPEGVQIAGLMDFLELAARMGQKFAPEAVDEMRAYAKTDPLGFYRSNNLFIDPRGDLTLNSGVTYAGRTLPKRGSEEQLRKSSAQAVNLATYLNDTQIGDMLRTDFDKINVGYKAGTDRYTVTIPGRDDAAYNVGGDGVTIIIAGAGASAATTDFVDAFNTTVEGKNGLAGIVEKMYIQR